jgi:hypothetical protein
MAGVDMGYTQVEGHSTAAEEQVSDRILAAGVVEVVEAAEAVEVAEVLAAVLFFP